MKSRRLLLITLGFALFALPAQAAPEVGIEEAAKIASEYLRENGHAGQHYVSALTLERDSLTRHSVHWYARWSRAIKSGERQETGLQIAMDRSLTRVVTKSAKERAREINRQGAQDIR